MLQLEVGDRQKKRLFVMRYKCHSGCVNKLLQGVLIIVMMAIVLSAAGLWLQN